MKWENMKRKHGATVVIGCISHICWVWACREATCSVKCNLQWPGLCHSQHSEWFGWGQRGLTQSNEFHYGRQGIQITHIQHKHRGRASDRVGAQHERQISGDIERKLDVGKGTVGKLAGGREGMRERRQKLGSDGKQNRAVDVEMQREEKGGWNDKGDNYGIKRES